MRRLLPFANQLSLSADQSDVKEPRAYLQDATLVVRELERVGNTVGYYARAPRIITLRPGRYVVKTLAKDYVWMEVPVVIEPGRITRVHLDAAWRPPAPASKAELVCAPAGYPVGWRTDSAKEFRVN